MNWLQDITDSITEPAGILIITAIIGLFTYRRQLVLNRKIKQTEHYEKKLDGLYETLSKIVGSYDSVLQELANLGDKYSQLPDLTNNGARRRIQDDIGKRFEILEKLIKDTHDAQTKGSEIIKSLANDPLIEGRFSSAVKTLDKLHSEIAGMLNRINGLLIPMNPLPSELSGGKTVSPELFKAIGEVINSNIEQIGQFQLYTQDAKKLVYNGLVGGRFLFKKYRPSYTEGRKALTKKGVRDYSVETSRWLRIKIFFRFIWSG